MGSLNRQNTLSKQTSAVFNMTLDELQASMGSGRPFGSMNMDEFLQTVWDKDPGLLNTQLSSEPMFGGDLFPQPSLDKSNLSLPQDYSGKTVDEVWNAIKANQTQPNYEQPFTVGHLLEGIGVVSDSPREPIQAAQLQFLQQFGQSQPEVRQAHVQHARLPDPPQLQIHSQGLTPSFSPPQYAAHQNQLNGRSALIQQASLQQFPQQQYIHPHQPQFPQPLPAHQPNQQQPNQASLLQPQTNGARRNGSPTKPQSVGKVSPEKAQASDSIPVNIRASTQYPPAQQASSGAGVMHSQAARPGTGPVPTAARPGTGPVPTAAPMPASPALDPQGRQQDSSLPVSDFVVVLSGCHAHLQHSCVQPFLLLFCVRDSQYCYKISWVRQLLTAQHAGNSLTCLCRCMKASTVRRYLTVNEHRRLYVPPQ
ncbi:TPA: Alpha-L-arabinofuranosidase, variant 2 [Trebouxia sp. C0004]